MVSQEGPSQPKKRLTRYSDAKFIYQNSQENTCVRVSILVKLQALGLSPAVLLKRDPGTGVFLWILRNLKEHDFYGTRLVDCFLSGNEYPFIKKCSKLVNDHEYKLHCSICHANLSCTHGGINDVRNHVRRDKHKAQRKIKTVS